MPLIDMFGAPEPLPDRRPRQLGYVGHGMAAARIDARGRHMVFAGAGHPPAMLARRGQNPVLLESRSMVLGALPMLWMPMLARKFRSSQMTALSFIPTGLPKSLIPMETCLCQRCSRNC